MKVNQKNILIICEGRDEISLFNRISMNYPIDYSHQFYCYNTNIHILGNHITSKYLDLGFRIEDLDIIQILKEFRNEEILNYKYTDILLVFDFDPHDPRFDINQLILLQQIFSESTNQGQLYINYPMVESSIDFLCFPEEEYINKKCDYIDLYRNGYKNKVKRESVINSIELIDNENLKHILKHTYDKVDYLVGLDDDKYSKLLTFQNKLLETENSVSIVCTSLLFLYDYNSLIFHSFITKL